jgi:hypothetical protein
MIATDSQLILDIYKWLPSYGENFVKCIFKNGNLFVEILYDGKDDTEIKKTLIFRHACFFSFSSFPGVEISKIEYGEIKNLGGLNEFKTSTAKELWTSNYGRLGIDIRHFFILFLSANKRLEVFAQDFLLEEDETENNI